MNLKKIVIELEVLKENLEAGNVHNGWEVSFIEDMLIKFESVETMVLSEKQQDKIHDLYDKYV